MKPIRHHFKRLAPKKEVLEPQTLSESIGLYADAIRALALSLEKFR